ncbi:hypothetical protein GCM10023201_44430 [Actinomycetospora corticicola]
MPHALEDRDLRPGAGRGLPALREGPDDGVSRGEDGQARARGGPLETPAGARHGGLGRRPVQREDRVRHRRVVPVDHPLGDRERHPPPGQARRPGVPVREARELPLPRARRLPRHRELVPGVVRVEHPHRVADPAAQQVRAVHRHPYDVGAAPVVPDEVDRPVEALQLPDQPVAVAVGRDVEPAGQGRPEPGRGQEPDVVAAELDEQPLPDRRRHGVAVHEHRRRHVLVPHLLVSRHAS